MINSKKLVFFVFPIKFFISHRLAIALSAIKAGYEVHLISTSGEGEKVLSENGIIFHEINITRSKANIFQELATIKKIYSLYNAIKPDLVHHITIKPILYGTLAARLTKVPAIVNAFSGLGYVFTRKEFRVRLLRTVVVIAYKIILKYKNLRSIVQNKDDKLFLITKSVIKAKQTVLIKGSGVDLNKFCPLPEPKGIPVVLLPSRLLRDKGVVEFVEAARILKEEKTSVRMVLVGEVDVGNPSSLSNDDIFKWQNEKIIEYWGFSSNMSETLRKATIVCLPSYREGLPKSLIEATASARAIITTNVPGCREMIDDQFPNGLLIPVKDSAALAESIKELINNPSKRKQMALNGRRMAEEEFSIDHMVNKTLCVYEELLD